MRIFDRAAVEFHDVDFEHAQILEAGGARAEVVLSLGAIQTPKVLMHSGIGDRAELAKFGIPVVQNLPGVGRNLHEEPQIPNFGRAGTGPRLKAGMTLAIEPMVNLGSAAVRTLEDDWTVVTADHMPSAHFEHTVLITKGEPQILTWREKMVAK